MTCDICENTILGLMYLNWSFIEINLFTIFGVKNFKYNMYFPIL